MKNIYSIVAGIAVLLTAGFVSGCKKGAEDPAISLRSRKARIVGEWDMTKGLKNGEPKEVIIENPQIGEVTEDWVFYEDGTVLTEDGTSELTGTWEFASNKEAITVTLHNTTAGTSIQSYDLVRLANKEMVWEQTIGTDKFRYELEFSSSDY